MLIYSFILIKSKISRIKNHNSLLISLHFMVPFSDVVPIPRIKHVLSHGMIVNYLPQFGSTALILGKVTAWLKTLHLHNEEFCCWFLEIHIGLQAKSSSGFGP